MFKKFFIIGLIVFSSNLFAKYDLRKCLILPVTGTKDLTFSNQVYQKTEDYLKEVNWCYYTPNSEIMDILSKYKENLNEYLEKKEVLQLVAEKTNTGALVRVQLIPQDIGVLVKFRVVGENGEDIYSKNEKVFPENDSDAIGEAITQWLEEYSQKIPFHAQITSVQEKTFKADMGSNIGFEDGMGAKIVRPLGKKTHPLLKEVIGWDTKDLGAAKFGEVQEKESLGEITELSSEITPVQGDWLIIEEKSQSRGLQEKKGTPKYGFVSLALDLGNAQQTIETYNFSNEYLGFMVGGYLKGEIWFLEHLWSSLELDARFGDLKGDYYPQTDSEERSFFKFKVGYRFLLAESFFGPQIDVYLGYGGYSYQPDVVNVLGPVDATFNGLIFGLKGNIPISEKIRAFLEAEMIFANGKSAQYNGGTTPGYSLFIGGNYFFQPKLSADLSLGGYNNTFENIVPGENVVYKDYSLRLGASLYF